jgi:nitrate/nitrite transporter NarK
VSSAASTPAIPAKPEMKTNPWFIASAVTGVTGFVVAAPAGYIWLMMKLTQSTCSSVVGSSGGGIFCASEAVRDRWFAATMVGLTLGVAGTIGLVAIPSKVQIAPTASTNSAGAVVLGQF